LLGPRLFDNIKSVPRKEKMITKKRGRPATGQGTLIGVRVHPSDLAALDKHRSKLEDKPSRPEAIRRIIAEYLGRARERGAY
jgi:hypothetical protein